MLVEYELLRDLRVLQGKYEELMKENEMLIVENEGLKKENKELKDEVCYLRITDKCYR